MIDPKMLTPEAGFVDGVVVEYSYHAWSQVENKPLTFHSFFIGVEKDQMIIRDWESDRGESDCSLIESIRPLTGPMAIWNFAPEWATCLMRDEHEFTFLASDEYGDGFESRPWWAK